MQGTLVAMKDCAYEASLVLSAFARVTRGHAALTTECGSMLEEVYIYIFEFNVALLFLPIEF